MWKSQKGHLQPMCVGVLGVEVEGQWYCCCLRRSQVLILGLPPFSDFEHVIQHLWALVSSSIRRQGWSLSPSGASCPHTAGFLTQEGKPGCGLMALAFRLKAEAAPAHRREEWRPLSTRSVFSSLARFL